MTTTHRVIVPTIETYTDDEAEFLAACIEHDLTHMYSDDGEVWRRGCRSLANVHRMGRALGSPERMKAIWDAVVDTKLVPSARGQFYWHDKSGGEL